MDEVEGFSGWERLGLYGGEGVHVLPDDAVALVDGEAGLAIDVDGLGVILVGHWMMTKEAASAAWASAVKRMPSARRFWRRIRSSR